MKNKHIIVIFLVQLLLVRGLANAQSPNAIPYQGVARNSAGNILASQPISLRISIHDVIPTGTVVYSETHAVTTTSLGLFSVNIGQGTIISGTLAGVNWGTGAKFRQVELDPAPPGSYIDLGTEQFESVPYALYAGTFQSGTAAGQMLYWNGSAWVTIPPGVVGQELIYGSNGPAWLTTDTVSITTAPVSNILGLSATCGGNILGNTTPVTASGVCWSTLPNPTIANNFTTDGTGYGSFVSNITGLTLFTTYYVRAYATTSAGTVYGNEISFTTLNTTFPTLATLPISVITGSTATSGGFISNDGGETITSRGVCWSTSPNPTTANSKTIDGTGIGTFGSNLTGLTANTTYYVRAYATNVAALTGYGNEISFTTFINSIGQPFQGGILAYFLAPGDPGYDANVAHGLIAAPSDQGTSVEWGCYGTVIAGADGTALGTGNQNTLDIIAGCATAGIAARLCGDFIWFGYSDWYLPSREELNKLYLNKGAIGGFASVLYWSSTELAINTAFSVNFLNGFQYLNLGKNGSGGANVRAIRAF